jgi:hypothetical protein
MRKDSYYDLQVVHLHLDTITRFIQDIVQQESVAIMLACQVFEEHKRETRKTTFSSEDKRLVWLRLRARHNTIVYLEQKSREVLQNNTSGKAIQNPA